jgi:hypothetical protein
MQKRRLSPLSLFFSQTTRRKTLNTNSAHQKKHCNVLARHRKTHWVMNPPIAKVLLVFCGIFFVESIELRAQSLLCVNGPAPRTLIEQQLPCIPLETKLLHYDRYGFVCLIDPYDAYNCDLSANVENGVFLCNKPPSAPYPPCTVVRTRPTVSPHSPTTTTSVSHSSMLGALSSTTVTSSSTLMTRVVSANVSSTNQTISVMEFDEKVSVGLMLEHPRCRCPPIVEKVNENASPQRKRWSMVVLNATGRIQNVGVEDTCQEMVRRVVQLCTEPEHLSSVYFNISS